jgi:hypothetical protein
MASGEIEKKNSKVHNRLNRGLLWLKFHFCRWSLALAEVNSISHSITTSLPFILSRVKQLCTAATHPETSRPLSEPYSFIILLDHHPSLSTDHNAEANPQLAIAVACHSYPPSDQMPTLATQA